MEAESCVGKVKKNKENVRPRGSNFCLEEELSLAQIVFDYKNIIENKTTNAVSPHEKEAAWEKISVQYNNCNRSCRSVEQLKAKFDNLKTQARKYAAYNKKCMRGTGGGPAQSSDRRSIIYDVILQIINVKTVSGIDNLWDSDIRLAVQPTIDDVIEVQKISPIIIESDMTEIVNFNKPMSEQFTVHSNVCMLDSPVTITLPEAGSTSTVFPQRSSSPTHWANYTPKMLKKPKNPKLGTASRTETYTVMCLREKYLKMKMQFLEKEDIRQEKKIKMEEEYHLKKMELISLEIDEKKRLSNQ